MRLKIKWNDDRVSSAATAILLICRDRLRRGEPDNSIQASLTEYRDDPGAYREKKAAWPEARDAGPLANPRHAAEYMKLVSAADELLRKVTRDKRQFNSLLELDNFLVCGLGNGR